MADKSFVLATILRLINREAKGTERYNLHRAQLYAHCYGASPRQLHLMAREVLRGAHISVMGRSGVMLRHRRQEPTKRPIPAMAGKFDDVIIPFRGHAS